MAGIEIRLIIGKLAGYFRKQGLWGGPPVDRVVQVITPDANLRACGRGGKDIQDACMSAAGDEDVTVCSDQQVLLVGKVIPSGVVIQHIVGRGRTKRRILNGKERKLFVDAKIAV